MERDAAFKHTELDTIPVSGLFIVVFLDAVAVEFGEFFVGAFGHEPPDAEHLLVKF